MERDFDLFGMPVDRATGKPGRPRKDATPEERNKIKLLMACGWTAERMATVARMSLPTFRRVFFQELRERDFMRDRLYARRLELLMLESDKGNVAALKELGRMLADSDRAFMEAELLRAQAGQPEPPMGKKEAAKLAAKAAESAEGWGDDLQFAPAKRAH